MEKNLLFEAYINDVRKYPRISPDEEISLAKKIQLGDDDALSKMITSNLLFVVKIARGFTYAGLELMDLITEGNIGLMTAAKKFNPAVGIRFSTYSSWWIKQAMRRAISNQSRTIRLPVHLGDKIVKLRRIMADFERDHGFVPSECELAEITGLKESRISLILSSSQSVAALDAVVDNASGTSLHNIITDESAVNSSASLDASDMLGHLTRVLEFLPEGRDKEILECRFGLGGCEVETLEQIGRRFGITRERTRQLQKKALGSLRRAFRMLNSSSSVAISQLGFKDAIVSCFGKPTRLTPRKKHLVASNSTETSRACLDDSKLLIAAA